MNRRVRLASSITQNSDEFPNFVELDTMPTAISNEQCSINDLSPRYDSLTGRWRRITGGYPEENRWRHTLRTLVLDD